MYHSSDGESGGVEKTTWEKYLKERKRKKKEKRSKVKETQPEEREGKEEDDDDDVGFDDPFFQHDITTATVVSNRESTAIYLDRYTTRFIFIEIQEDKEKQTESRRAGERQEGEGKTIEGLKRADSCHNFKQIFMCCTPCVVFPE